ncbi:hypothetical protein H0W80_04900 [Candidatus Saccharibacteria bacterium]|nr:hypothetical protein [Candidatus Saccharibacteria bacterium]
MKDGASPNYYNVRLYARNSTDRRVAVGTRKGPSFYTVPLGEAVDQQQTSVTGASDQTITETTWVGGKFTAGVSGRLSKVELNVKLGTTPTQHLIVKVYSDSAGSPGTLMATSSVLLGDATTSYAYETARFIEAPVIASGTAYWIVCSQQKGGAGNWMWSTTTTATTSKTSTNSGGTWGATSFDLNLKTYVSTSSKFMGGLRFTPSSGTNKTVIAHGTSAYSVNDLTGATTLIETGLSASATDYYFDQSDDKLFYTNGYDAPRYWNGTTVTALTSYLGAGKFIAFHKNRLFTVDPTDPTKVKYSELGDYAASQSTNFFYAPSPKSGDPVVGLHVFQDNLLVFTRKTKYVLYGDDPGNFVLRQSSGKRGAVSQNVIQSDPNYVYYLSDNGVYRYNGSADELMSDTIQTEVDSMNDKTKASAVIQNNYYRLYYPSQTSPTSDASILWDTLNKFWLRDTGTYVYRPFVLEDDTLIEGSSVVGQLFYAETQYSDMGRPIEFVYWTKCFGDGIRKILLRRVVPSIRLQTQPYDLDVMIDVDQRNTASIGYTVDAQASGSKWGAGSPTNWGAGSTVLWGSATVSSPTVMTGTEAYWHQIRFEHTGVDTPVEILSYLLQIRVRRTE